MHNLFYIIGQIVKDLADVSETIASKDLGEMAVDITDFARRNPLAFPGGAALTGFTAQAIAEKVISDTKRVAKAATSEADKQKLGKVES